MPQLVGFTFGALLLVCAGRLSYVIFHKLHQWIHGRWHVDIFTLHSTTVTSLSYKVLKNAFSHSTSMVVYWQSEHRDTTNRYSPDFVVEDCTR